jgi:MFS family permease
MRGLQRFTLSTTMLISFFGLAVVIPVFAPLLIGEQHTLLFSGPASLPMRLFLLGLLIAAFPLAGFFGTPLIEGLSDRRGRKPILALTLSIAAISYVLCALGIIWDHMLLLLLSRLVGGFAGSSAAVAVQAVGDVKDEQRRAKIMASMATLGGFGFLIGPLLGGKLADPRIVSWFTDATPFWFMAILSLLNLVLILFGYRESLQFKRKSSLNCLRGCYALGEALTTKELGLIATIFLLFGLAWSFFIDFFPVYLVQKWGFIPAQIGDYYIYITAWYFAVQWFLIGPASRLLVKPGLLPWLMLLAPFVLLLLLLPNRYSWEFLITPLTVATMTLALPTLYSILPAVAKWKSGEQLVRVSHALQTVSYIFAPLIGGLVAGIAMALPTILAAAAALIAWILLLTLLRRYSLGFQKGKK